MDILATLWAPGVERLQSPALLAQRFLLQLLPHLGFRSSDCAELLAPLGLGMAFCLLISPIGETDAALVVLLCLIILYLIYNYIICVYIYIYQILLHLYLRRENGPICHIHLQTGDHRGLHGKPKSTLK